jgi:cytochrome b561
MDLFTVVIIAAMLLTVGAVLLGVLSMSAGGSTDDHFSTRLMWARVGFSVLTLLLPHVCADLASGGPSLRIAPAQVRAP